MNQCIWNKKIDSGVATSTRTLTSCFSFEIAESNSPGKGNWCFLPKCSVYWSYECTRTHIHTRPRAVSVWESSHARTQASWQRTPAIFSVNKSEPRRRFRYKLHHDFAIRNSFSRRKMMNSQFLFCTWNTLTPVFEGLVSQNLGWLHLPKVLWVGNVKHTINTGPTSTATRTRLFYCCLLSFTL